MLYVLGQRVASVLGGILVSEHDTMPSSSSGVGGVLEFFLDLHFLYVNFACLVTDRRPPWVVGRLPGLVRVGVFGCVHCL